MKIKAFQDKAITHLQQEVYRLWQSGNDHTRLVFKSPTGSGKTIMVSDLLRRLSGDARFDPDKAFVWISFNPDNVEQSRKKLEAYLEAGLSFIQGDDFSHGRLRKNDVYFVNWQKLAARNKDSRRLRVDGESRISFDTFMANTHADGREIILIIDEAHLARDRDLSNALITEHVKPRLELQISATPSYLPSIEDVQDDKAGFVSVTRDEVAASGLIKNDIHIMPREEVEQALEAGQDMDLALLDLAISKRAELAGLYDQAGLPVNPLVLIKLPNDDADSRDASGRSKLELVQAYLADQGIDPKHVAVWLTDKKENLEAVTHNLSPVQYLIFNQAAATGWDCPRADILVMFREIRSPAFETQVLGRVLRTATGEHVLRFPALNDAYVYVNYSRREILEANDAAHRLGANKQKDRITLLRKDVANIELPSVFLARAVYNDLGDDFQLTFFKEADRFFKVKPTDTPDKVHKALTAAGLDLAAAPISNDFIVNARIEVYDDFKANIARSAEDMHAEASYNDTRKTYDLVLRQELRQQVDEDAKYNTARSFSPLKSAINLWFRERAGLTHPPLFAVVCTDLARDDMTPDRKSVLRPLITKALLAYRPLRTQHEAKKADQALEKISFRLATSFYLPEDHEPVSIDGRPIARSSHEPFLLPPAYPGRDNEMAFIAFLEANARHIDWWFKNGDYGRQSFAVPYKAGDDNTRLFYPDFLIRQGNQLAIIDTKSGITARDAGERAKGLADYLQAYDGELELWGGIAVRHGKNWLINDGRDYRFDGRDFSGWTEISF